ncbi:E3 ubiquitin-protein ligase SIAH1A-like [Aethina tumida]|uniref:E3 ubiquitin-protein ligase SIAH1A-like n=1 Tax=Aethina tumida TaxID=116153 RepID=UPI0021479655|nr:E3 ubiquitin-protein ligase SIAH1A-like [Aethina tumida]
MYDLINEFKCVVCFDYMKPPIQMCVNGHSYCRSCFRRMNKCPECRGKRGHFRNLQLENIFGKLVFPCQNEDNGCDFVAKGLEVMAHEGKCIYGHLSCPFANYGCPWSGLYSRMEDHLRDAHNLMNDIPDVCDLEGFNEGANCWRQVLKFDGLLFILCVIKEEESFWFGLYSIINTDVMYSYEVTFVDFKENKTATFNGNCSTHKKYATKELNMHNMQNAPVSLIERFRKGDSVKYLVKIFRSPRQTDDLSVQKIPHVNNCNYIKNKPLKT